MSVVSIGGASAATGVVSINGTTGVHGVIASLGISTSANDSVVIGLGGAQNQSGINNLFIGYQVAALSTVGNNNVGLGYQAAYSLAGNGNVIMGSMSGKRMTLSSGNVALGVGSAALLQGAFSNVIVGAGADATTTNAAGCIAIGANCRASGGNGNVSVAATAIGVGARADGRYALALGAGVVASGDGSFTVANRLRGYRSTTDAGSYVVQVDADALKLANGGVVAFAARTFSAVSSAALATPADQPVAWRIGLEGNDLVFRSAGGSVVRMVDDYVSGVLDFVASHSAQWGVTPPTCAPCAPIRVAPNAMAVSANLRANRHPHAFLVVSSVADACGLVGEDLADGTDYMRRDRMRRDCMRRDGGGHVRAVPRVAVCGCDLDCRTAFGVVAPHPNAPDGTSRARQVGHIAFSRGDDTDTADTDITGHSASVTVYSLGEGWIWVTLDARGVRAGDLLAACPHTGGTAVVSHTQDVVTATTIAKATRSCCAAPPNAPPNTPPNAPPNAPENARGTSCITLVPCTYRF